MLVTQARYVAPDISGVSKSRVSMASTCWLLGLNFFNLFLFFVLGFFFLKITKSTVCEMLLTCRAVL